MISKTYIDWKLVSTKVTDDTTHSVYECPVPNSNWTYHMEVAKNQDGDFYTCSIIF